MAAEKQITEWLTRALALIDGVTCDYVSIEERVGARSWSQVARVDIGARSIELVIAEILGHVSDIQSGATEAGRPGWSLRCRVFRGGGPAGTRVFSSVGPGESADDSSLGREGELVATVGELRRMVVSQTEIIGRIASDGWRLAVTTQGQLAATQKEAADLKAELAVLASGMPADEGGLRQLGEMFAPMALQIFMNLQQQKSPPPPPPDREPT